MTKLRKLNGQRLRFQATVASFGWRRHPYTTLDLPIIVLHDIHKQSVMAISPVVEELLRQDYTFLAFDKGQFAKFERPQAAERSGGPAEAAAAPRSHPRR